MFLHDINWEAKAEVIIVIYIMRMKSEGLIILILSYQNWQATLPVDLIHYKIYVK